MFSLLLAAALEFTAQDARLAYETAGELVEKCTPRDAGTIRCHVIAANRILDAASAAGADVRRDCFRAMTPKGERDFTNLYAEFKSDDARAKWVVLISHYDTKPGCNCPGANDGASTSGLLVGVANAVSSWKGRKGNLLLVWADGEECMESYGPNDGFWGSKRAVEMIASENRQVQAVVCLDMLGDKDLSISIPSNGTKTLAKLVQHAARRAGYPDIVKPMTESVKDDHVAFLDRGYPAVDLIDFEYGPQNAYWHTPQDTMDKISEDSLLKSGKIVAELLNILL